MRSPQQEASRTTVSAQDVAAAIIKIAGPVDPMKLQKLLYYAQAWNLAWYSEPLFEEEIEAWGRGPVVPSVYREYKRHRWNPIDTARKGNPDRLSDSQLKVLGSIVEAYGRLNALELKRLTHEEEPWVRARSGLPPSARSSTVIPVHEMQEYYRNAEAFGARRPKVQPVGPELLSKVISGDGRALAEAFEQSLGVAVEAIESPQG